MPETILPRINVNNSISNHVKKLTESIDSSLTSNTLVLHKKLLKPKDIGSPIKTNSPRSKSASIKHDESISTVTRLGLCTSPVTKRDVFEVVKTRQEASKNKDAFALMQSNFAAKFNAVSKDDNSYNSNIITQSNDNNGSLITQKNVHPLSLSLRQTSAEIQSYQEATKRRLNNLKKLELDITATVKPPRAGESFDEKQRKRNRMRAETYAINEYLKGIENSKWEKLKAEQSQADDISWCSDDSSVLPTPRYRTSSEKKKSSKDNVKVDVSSKKSSKKGNGKPPTRSFGGV
jgi:hypothetical protein